MIDCVSVQNMRLSDRKTIEKGISGRELICRAANGIFHAVDWFGRIAVVTGSGNNGADGFALSSILYRNGYDVTVFSVSEHMHEDCAYFARISELDGVPSHQYYSGYNMLSGYDMIVDCILGTGFNGELREISRNAIDEINNRESYVVSVDINSGMNGDTGEGDIVVRSDLTVVIEFIKNGMVKKSAEKYISKMVCVKIGIELAAEENKICDEREWDSILEKKRSLADINVLEDNGVLYYKCPPWLVLN